MVLKVKLSIILVLFSLIGASQTKPYIFNDAYVSYDGKLIILSSPFSPLDYDPIAWYDSQDLTTITKDGSNYVSQWNDKSGNGYNLVQTTGANQPLYNASNGIVFDGTNDYLYSNFGAKTQPLTIIVVYNTLTGCDENACLIDGYVGALSNTQLYFEVGKINIYAGLIINYNKTKPFSTLIETSIFNGSISSIYENNILKVSANIGTYGLNGIKIGNYTGYNYPYKGEIKEVIIYNSALTTEQITSVNTYLNTKYNVY